MALFASSNASPDYQEVCCLYSNFFAFYFNFSPLPVSLHRAFSAFTRRLIFFSRRRRVPADRLEWWECGCRLFRVRRRESHIFLSCYVVPFSFFDRLVTFLLKAFSISVHLFSLYRTHPIGLHSSASFRFFLPRR